MKKLVLLLVIGLGLVSAVNAESVCKERDSYPYDYDIAKLIDDKYNHRNNLSKAQERKNEQLKAAWRKLLLRSYVGELKRSDKESLCLYMDITITDYLKTTLTPQEIERFEKFLIGYTGTRYNGEYTKYESYEQNKDDYLNALKFLKHFDKMEYWYSKLKGYKIESYASYDYVAHLVDRVKTITNYNDNPKVYAKRFVHGKSLGNPFKFQETYNDYSLNGMKNMQNRFGEDGKYCVDVMSVDASCHETKELKYVIQWAESKIKEAKK